MVYCFMEDMTAETGIAHESIKHSENHDLLLHFVIEDDGKSVCTDARAAWNQPRLTYEGVRTDRITYYRYQTKYPQAEVVPCTSIGSERPLHHQHRHVGDHTEAFRLLCPNIDNIRLNEPEDDFTAYKEALER
jgi:hypothetical protein